MSEESGETPPAKIKKRRPLLLSSSSESDSDNDVIRIPKRLRVIDDSSDTSGSSIKVSTRNTKMLPLVADSDDGSSSAWSSDDEQLLQQPKPSTSGGFNSDSSDGTSDKCPICLARLARQEIGTPESCEHVFCLDCITEWSTNVNTCPVDRQTFNEIVVRACVGGRVLRKVPVKVTVQQQLDEIIIEEDPTFCEICGSSDDDNHMLLCDGCDLGYHMQCLSPPLNEVPLEQWFCPNCAPDALDMDDEFIYMSELDDLLRENQDIVRPLGPPPSNLRRSQSSRRSGRLQSNNGEGSSSSANISNRSRAQTSSSNVTSHRVNHTRTKRRRKRRTTRTVIVEYEVNGGGKFPIKKTVKKTKRRKVKKRQPRTAARRSHVRASVRAKLTTLKQVQVDTANTNEGVQALSISRYRAGIPNLSLFGSANELEYFPDEEEISTEGVGVVAIAPRQPTSQILSSIRQARRKTLRIPSPQHGTTAPDLLSSIMETQAAFHSKNSLISISVDGQVNVKLHNNDKNPSNDKKEKKNDTEKVDMTAKESDFKKTPMYSNNGRGGNRSGINRGGYREQGDHGNYNSGNYNNYNSGNTRNGSYSGGFGTNQGNQQDSWQSNQRTFLPLDRILDYPPDRPNFGTRPLRGRGGPLRPFLPNRNIPDSPWNNNFQQRHSFGGFDSAIDMSIREQRENGNHAIHLNDGQPQRSAYFEPTNQDESFERDGNYSVGENVQYKSLTPPPLFPSARFEDHQDNCQSSELEGRNQRFNEDNSGSEHFNNDEEAQFDPLVPPPLFETQNTNNTDSNLLIPPPSYETQNTNNSVSNILIPPPSYETQITNNTVSNLLIPPPSFETQNTNNTGVEMFQTTSSIGLVNENRLFSDDNYVLYKKEEIVGENHEAKGNEAQQFTPLAPPQVLETLQRTLNESIDEYDPMDPTQEDSSDEETNRGNNSNILQNCSNEEYQNIVSSEYKSDNDEDGDCPNFSIYSATSVHIAKTSSNEISQDIRNVNVEELYDPEVDLVQEDDDDENPMTEDEKKAADEYNEKISKQCPITANKRSPIKIKLQSTVPLIKRIVPTLYDEIDDSLSQDHQSDSEEQKTNAVVSKVSEGIVEKVSTPETVHESSDKIVDEPMEQDTCLTKEIKDITSPDEPEHQDSVNPITTSEKMTESISESEDERSFTPCLDENKSKDNSLELEKENKGLEGLETELISEEENNEIFSDSNKETPLSPKETDNENCSKNGARTPSIESEKIEGMKKKKTKKRDPKDKIKSKKTDVSFKKLSKSGKERNYRDRDVRDKIKDRPVDKENKERQKSRKEKRKDLERYDVRTVVTEKKRRVKDAFGRDASRSPSRLSPDSRGQNSPSFPRTPPRTPVSPPGIPVSPPRIPVSPPKSRRSTSRGRKSPSKSRRSISRGRKSVSKSRRSFSRGRRSISRGRTSPALVRRRSPRKSVSRGRRSPSRSKKSPKRRSPSPFRMRRSPSPLRIKRISSPRLRRSISPKRRRSISPRARSPFRRLRRSMSPRKRLSPLRRRSASPRKRSLSPRRRRSLSRGRKRAKKSPVKTISKEKLIKRKKKLTKARSNSRNRSRSPKRKTRKPKRLRSQSPKRKPNKIRRKRKSKSVSPELLLSPEPNPENWEAKSPLYQEWSSDQSIFSKLLSPGWTPPHHFDDAEAYRDPSRQKRKKTKKRQKQNDHERSRHNRVQRDAGASKEVFTSGNNILVSVSFNKNDQNEFDTQNEPTAKKRRRRDSKRDKIRKKRVEMAQNDNIKPVAIIDLDKSPFLEITQSPKNVIVLSDSDSGEKENLDARPGRNDARTKEVPTQTQDSITNVVVNRESQFMNIVGPKTPPEPVVKFSIMSKPQAPLRPVNPLQENDDKNDEEIEQGEIRDNVTKGPNTPPEPPHSPASSQDAYDPFEPTKSRSASPGGESKLENEDTQIDIIEKTTITLETAQKTHLSADDVVNQRPISPMEKVMALLQSTKNVSPTRLDEKLTDDDNKLENEGNNQPNEGGQLGDAGKVGTIQGSPRPAYSTVAPTIVSSGPVYAIPRIGAFNSSNSPNTLQVPSQRIVLPSPKKAQPPKLFLSKPSPIKSTPIKPMPAKTIISKLPLPIIKPIPGLRKNKMRNNDVVDLDIDDSPYSPGSSDFGDLFEPPSERKGKGDVFDSLFGSKPKRNFKTKGFRTKKRKARVALKMDDDSLKVMDDLPSSAVEMQVKNKFLVKLNRQERVVEEVKLVLKPHFNKKHVTKDEYKDILRKAVPKICHNKNGEINPAKIHSLIEAYVRKYRKRRKFQN